MNTKWRNKVFDRFLEVCKEKWVLKMPNTIIARRLKNLTCKKIQTNFIYDDRYCLRILVIFENLNKYE